MVTCFICLLVGESSSFYIQFNCVSSLTHFSAQIFVELNDSWQPQWFPWFCLFCICSRLRVFIGDFESYPALQPPAPTPVPSGPPPALFLVLQMLQGTMVYHLDCSLPPGWYLSFSFFLFFFDCVGSLWWHVGSSLQVSLALLRGLGCSTAGGI